MTKAEYIALLARRLGVSAARIDGLVERLHTAGVIKTTKGSRRYPPDIDEYDATALLLAVLSDTELDQAADNTWRIAALHSDTGRFDDFVRELLCGPPRNVQHVVIGAAGVSTVVDGRHVVFGQPPQTASRIVLGATLAAIAAELAGMTPPQADAAAAIARIHNGHL